MLYKPDGSVASSGATRADRQYEAEAAVREKLKSIDSLLDIKYIEWAGRYSLICQWPQSDNRWKMYETGEISEPFDSLGWFCEDMQDPSSLPVSVDSIENLVIERIASCDNTLFPWRDRMKDIIAKNAKVRKDRQKEITDRAEDIAGTLWNAVGRHDATHVERIIEEISGGVE